MKNFFYNLGEIFQDKTVQQVADFGPLHDGKEDDVTKNACLTAFGGAKKRAGTIRKVELIRIQCRIW